MVARNERAGHEPARAAPGADGHGAALPDGARWCLDATGTWRQVPDPIPFEDGADGEEGLRNAGFHRMASFGIEGAQVRCRIYERIGDDTFLGELWLGDGIHHVVLPGVPAVLRFLGMALPLVNAAAQAERDEEEDAKKLREWQRKWKAAAPEAPKRPPAVPPRAPAGGLFPEVPSAGPYTERR
jgi:hypothetical protein